MEQNRRLLISRQKTNNYNLYVTLKEVGAEVGVSRDTVRKYLADRGFPGKILREKKEEAVSILREILKEKEWYNKGKSQDNKSKETESSNWNIISSLYDVDWIWEMYLYHEGLSKKCLSLSEFSQKMKLPKNDMSVIFKKWIKDGFIKEDGDSYVILKRDRKKEVVKENPVNELDCSWRVSIMGDYGWLVIRCGAKEDMQAWARQLVSCGITAEARQNKYPLN